MSAAVDFDPADPADFEEGRTFPFASVGDYVALSGISDRACRVYWLMRMHVNRKREKRLKDSSAWPAQTTLADIIGVKKTDTIAAAVKELVELGAVEVEVIRTPTGRRNKYRVHLAPPRGHDGHTCLDDYYDARRDAAKAKAEAAGPDVKPQVRRDTPKSGGIPPSGPATEGVPPKNGVSITRNPGGPIPPDFGCEPQEVQPEEENQGGGDLVGDVTSAPSPTDGPPAPSSPLRADWRRPETCLCATHLALRAENPDADIPSCRRCRDVREWGQQKRAERQAQVAQVAADCRWHDPGGWLVDPASGLPFEPAVRCDHQLAPQAHAARVATRAAAEAPRDDAPLPGRREAIAAVARISPGQARRGARSRVPRVSGADPAARAAAREELAARGSAPPGEGDEPAAAHG